jgi:hypothetical protein
MDHQQKLLNERTIREQLEAQVRALKKEVQTLRKESAVDDFFTVYIPKRRYLYTLALKYSKREQLSALYSRCCEGLRKFLRFTSFFLNEFCELLWPMQSEDFYSEKSE